MNDGTPETLVGYEGLANAIIILAVRDFRFVYRRTLVHPEDELARMEAKRQEKFFYSEWFALLTNVDGPVLLREIKKREDQAYAKMRRRTCNRKKASKDMGGNAT